MWAGFQTQKRKAPIVANYWWIPNAALCNSSQMHFRVKVCCRVKLIPWHQFGWGHFLPHFLMLPSDSHMCWIIAWNYSFFHTFQMCTHAKIKPRVMHQWAYIKQQMAFLFFHVKKHICSRSSRPSNWWFFQSDMHRHTCPIFSHDTLGSLPICLRIVAGAVYETWKRKIQLVFPHFWKQS